MGRPVKKRPKGPRVNEMSEALRSSRLSAGMTQQELADILGITPWTYNRIEKGKRSFQAEWLRKLPPILTSKRAFIAVGAGHLAGSYGLIAGLRKRGFRVRAIPIN